MSKTIKIQSTKNGFKVVKTKAIANEKYIIADETGKPLNKLKFVQKDKNLEIYTEVDGKEQQIVTLEDYYAPDMNASVVGLSETNEELAYVYNENDGWYYLLNDTELGFAFPLVGIGAAGAAGVGIAAVGGSGGNDGNGSNTSSVDTTPPATPASVSVPEATNGINASEASDGVEVLVTLPSDAVAGDVITVSIDGGIAVTHTVTAAEVSAISTPITVTLPQSAISAAGEGAATITTTVTDSSGNVSPAITTNVTIDTVAPGTSPATPASVSVPEATNGISSSEASDGVEVLVTLPSDAVAGDVITVSIDGGIAVTHTVTAAEVSAISTPITVTLPQSAISAAGEGAATITTTVTDSSGNVSPAITTNVTIDTVAPGTSPATPASVSVPEATNGISSSEASDGVEVLVTLPSDAVAGDVITVSIDGGTAVTHTVTAAEVAAISTPITVTLPQSAISAAGEGAATITTTVTDSSGNVSTPITTNVTIDTVAPGTAPATPASVSVPEATNGINASEASDGVEVLVTLPSDAVAGDVITVSIDGGTAVTHTVTAAEVAAISTPITVTLPQSAISAAGEGAATITTTVTDSSGNVSPAITTNVTIDTVAPGTSPATPASVSVPEATNGISSSEASDGVEVLVTLPSDAVAGDVITVSIDGGTAVTHTVTAAEVSAISTPITVTLPQSAISAAGEGAATITTTVTDSSGNVSTPITTNVTIDTVAPGTSPATPASVSVPEATNGINASEASDGVEVLVTLPSDAVAGDVITVSIDGGTAVTHTVTAAEVAAISTPITVTLPQSAISAAGEGAATITTTVTDSSGNVSTPITTNVTIDTVAPGTSPATPASVSVPEATNGISSSEASDGVEVLVTLPSDAVAGDVITVSIDGGTAVTHTVTAAEVAAISTPITVTLPQSAISAAGEGAATITTTVTDSSGNVSTPITTNVTIDTVAPGTSPATPASVSVPEATNGINASEASDGVEVLVTLPSDAVAGDVITVSIDGGTAVTHTVTAAEVSAISTPITVTLPQSAISAAGEGAATITTTVTDSSGNVSTPITTNVTIDTVAPGTSPATPASVSVPEATNGINASEASDGVEVLVTLPSDAVAGDVITVSIDGGTAVTHTVTAAEVAAISTPITVTLPQSAISAAGEGAATITTTVTDSSGNVSTPITTNVTIDTVAPGTSPATPASVSVPEATNGINASEASDGVEVLVTLPSDAVAGDVITVSIDGGTAVTHTVTAAEVAAISTPITVTLPQSAISAAGEGAATITTTVTDSSGNVSTPITTNVTIDTVAPGTSPATPASVSVPEATNGINASEASDGVEVLVTLPSDAVAGDVITVSIDGGTAVTHTVTAAEVAAISTPITVTLPQSAISAAGEGAATITTTVTDSSGNVSTPITTNVTIDTVAPGTSPATPASVSVPEATNGINASEASDGVEVLVTLPSDAVAGDVITVSIDGGTAVTHTVTAAEVAAISTPITVTLPQSAISAAGEGAATITTTVTDSSGNVSTPITTNVTIDTVAPGTSPATPASVSVPEATNGINASEASDGVEVLVTLPSDAVAGDVITVSIDGGTAVTHTVTAAEVAAISTPITVTLPQSAISAAGEGAATITTTVTDSSGNVSTPITTNVTIDTVAPGTSPATPASVSVPEATNGINASEASDGVEVLVTLPSDAVAGDVITVSIDGGTAVTHTVTAAEVAAISTPITVTLPQSAISAAGEGAATITTTVTDSSGNVSTPITTNVTIDTVAPGTSPATPASVSVPEATNGINASEASDGVEVLVTLPSDAVAGDVITVSIDGGTAVTHTVTAAEVAAISTPITVTLPQSAISAAGEGAATITTTVTDSSGNVSTPITTNVTIDTVAPGTSPATPASVSVPEATNGISSSEASDGVEVLVTLPSDAVAGDVITVSIDGGTAVTHTVTAAEVAAISTPITVTLPQSAISAAGEGAATITTTVTDSSGNVSTPITTNVTIDTVAPGTSPATPASVSVPEATNGINASEASDGVEVLVTLPSDAVAGDVITVSIDGGTAVTHTVTAAEVAAISTPITVTLPQSAISAAGEGAATITTTVTDSSGNVSPAITTNVTIDTVAPGTAPATPASVSVPEATNGINASEASDGVEVLVTLPSDAVAGDVITVSIDGGTAVTHTVTAAEVAAISTPITVTLPQSAISAAGEGAATITTTVTDSSGNVSTPITTNVTIDTVAPGTSPATPASVSVPEATNGINASEASDGVEVLVTLPSDAVAGDVITVSIDGGTAVTHTVTAAEVSAISTPITVTLPQSAISAAGEGAATITTTVTDSSGNVSTPITTNVTIDTVAPGTSPATPASVSVPEATNGINASEASDGVEVLVTLPSDAVAGDVITVSIDGGTAVTHTVTAAEVAAISTPITVTLPQSAISAAGEGAATITTTVTDSSGNVSTPITTNVTIDTVAPGTSPATPASVSVPEATNGINASEASDGVEVLVTLPSDAVAGDVITVSIDGGTAVTHTVTAAEVAAISTPITVTLPQSAISAAGEGAATITTTVTDSSGNVSPAITTNVTIDTVAPGTSPATPASVSVPEATNGISSSEASDGVEVLVTLPSDAVAGDVITVSIDGGTAVTHTVTAAEVAAISTPITVTLPQSAISAAGEGAATITTTVTDSSGNVSTPITTNVTIDTVAPGTSPATPASVSVPEATNGINASEASDGVEVLVTLPSDAVAGDVITVSIDGGTAVTHTVTAAEVAAISTPITVTLPQSAISAAGEGAATITTTVTDSSGNVSTPITTNVTIDTVAPGTSPATPASVSVPEATNGINASEASDGVEVLVTLPSDAVAGDVITVSIDGGTAVTHTVTAAEVAAISTPITVTLPQSAISAAGEGAATITTTVTDSSGNVSTPITTNVTIDTTPPTAGTISLSNFTDSGSNTTDNISNDNTFDLTISGNEAGSTVVYQISTDGGVTWTTTTANQSAITDGTYSFRATVTDSAGNSATTPVQSVTIDTTPPTAGTISLSNFTDSGSNTTDNISNDNTFDLTISGNEAGSTVVYQISTDGGVTWTTTTANQSAITDGTYSFRATVTDSAGNSATTPVQSVTIDTTPPTAGTISLSNFTDSGSNTTDNISNDNTFDLTISGNEAGSTVVYQISTDGGVTWTTTTANQSAITDGTYSFRATVTDSAGNSATTPVQSVTIDTTPPAAGTLSLSNYTDSGSSATDNISNDNTFDLTISGQEAGTTVVYQISTDGGVTWTTTTANQSAITDGTYSFRATVTDSAGNSAITPVQSVTIDTTPPAAGTLSLSNYTDSGSSATDNISNDNTFDLTISGQEAGTTVVYQISTDGGTTWATTTANQSAITDGTYSFRAIVTDVAGNTGTTASSLNYTVDTIAPSATITMSDSALKIGDTSIVTITFSEAVSGFELADLTAENGALSGLTTSDNITWTATFTPTANIEDTTNVISLANTYTDVAGNTGTTASSLNYTVDTKILVPTLALATDSGSSNSDGITNISTINVSNLESGATWEYSVDGGTWIAGTGTSFNASAGIHTYSVRQTDTAGNISTGSSAVTYNLDTAAIAGTLSLSNFLDSGSSSSDNISNDNNFDLTISGNEAGSTVVYEVSTNGGITWTNTTANQTTLADGTYSFRATVTDIAGNSATTPVQTVTVDTTPPSATVNITAISTDSGTAGDFITNDNNGLTISATLSTALVSGEKLMYSKDNGTTWIDITSSVTGTTVSYIDSTLTSSTTIQMRVLDAASNAGVADSQAIVIDTTVAVPTLALATDSGSSNSDGITNISTINVSNLESGATWEYSVDGAPWTAGTGTSFNASAGTHTYSVRQTDVAGNVSTGSSTVTYVLDSSAPTLTISDNISTTTATTAITYTFQFSEAVSDFDSSDIVITNTEIHSPSNEDTRWTAGTFTAIDADTYTYTITPDGGTGTLNLDVTTGSFSDAVGNANTADTTSVDQRYSVIDMGADGKLIHGVQVEGKWYYYWDRSGDGTKANTGSLNGGADNTTHDVLDGIFKYDINGNLDTDSNTDNTYRYATLNGVKVALPTYGGVNAIATDTGFKAGTAVSNNTTTENTTYNDLLAIWDSYNGATTGTYIPGVPSGWAANGYWSATTSTSGHAIVNLNDGYVFGSNDTYNDYVALQVL